jgi:TonB-dependent receptor
VTATGLNSTFEWRPNENVRFRIDGSYNNRDTNRGRQRREFELGFADSGTIVEGDNYSQFTTENTYVTHNVRDFYETQEIINLVGTAEVKVGEWTLDFMAGLNRGSFDGDADKDISASFDTFAAGDVDLQYTAGGYTPTITQVGGPDINDPDNFALFRLDRGTSFSVDEEIALGLNAKRDASLFDGDGFWKLGGKTRFFSRDYDFVSRRFDFDDNWTLDRYIGNPAIGSIVADYNAKSSVDGAYRYPFFVDPDRLRAVADILEANGDLFAFADDALRSQAQSYTADEDIYAFFGMGQFSWGKLTALFGARGELTRVAFSGNDAETDNSGEIIAVTPYSVDNSYLDVLPGLHLRYDQTKNLLYRFSVTRSIARPRLGDINPSRFVNFDDQVVTTGDIDLKPVSSINIDLGAEYYIGSAGVLSAGVFIKEMKDNIYTEVSTINDPLSAEDGFELRQSRNAESAYVRGIELSYDQQFTFLPAPFDGVGMTVNYTYADSEVDIGFPVAGQSKFPLFDQVENSANFSLFYAKHDLNLRASLNYRDDTLFSIDANDARLSRYQAESLVMDLTASYRFAANWTASIEFSNLLNEPNRAYNGSESRFDYNEYTDWSGTFRISWNL